MKKNWIRRPSHQLSIALILVSVISFLSSSTTFAVDLGSISNKVRMEEINSEFQIIRLLQQVSPTVTIHINLPLIEQIAQTTPEPAAADTAAVPEVEIETGTQTPTPIPVQSGSANLPIVIGALAIIAVIILAWFFIGFLPNRNRD
jgi:hypothetical protein